MPRDPAHTASPHHTPLSPSTPARRVLVRSGLRDAMHVLRGDAAARVHLFEPTWEAVDRARTLVRRLGLSERIHVWHVVGEALAARLLEASPATSAA